MPKRQQKQPTIQQQLIEAVQASQYSQNQLAKLSDIPQPTINAFVNGKRGLSLDCINRLCKVLKLELVKQ